MSRIRTAFTALIAATLATSCGPDIVGPRTTLDGLPPGLQVQLTVEPSVVAPDAPFAATLSVTNTTSQELRVTTAHGCLATPHVMRGDRRFPFEGSWWGCTAAITTHVFPAGETRSHSWNMRAQLYAEYPGDTDGAPAARATYRVRAEFDTYPPTAPGGKPAIERSLIVR